MFFFELREERAGTVIVRFVPSNVLVLAVRERGVVSEAYTAENFSQSRLLGGGWIEAKSALDFNDHLLYLTFKHWSRLKNMQLFSGRHVVYKCQYHLVFVTKYRREAINAEIWKTLSSKFNKVIADFEGSILEENWEQDHAHLLVDFPPKHSISKVVNSLKGVSSRAVKRGTFWSPSYCALTCGGAPLEVIKNYITNQRNSSSR